MITFIILVVIAAWVSYFVWLNPEDDGESERYEEEKNRRNAQDINTLFGNKNKGN